MTNVIIESSHDPESGVIVIRLERDYGSTQSHELTQLETRLHSLLDAPPNAVLLDLRDNDLIGAEFLSVLTHFRTRAKLVNCCIALCMSSVFSTEVVSLVCLDTTCPTFGSRQSAIEFLVRAALRLAAPDPLLSDGKVPIEIA